MALELRFDDGLAEGHGKPSDSEYTMESYVSPAHTQPSGPLPTDAPLDSARPSTPPDEAGHLVDVSFVEVGQLHDLTTRELRMLCNQAYRMLDTDWPPFESVGRYQTLCDALDVREAAAHQRSRLAESRERFRDNQWTDAFELIRNGVVAGRMRYRLRQQDVSLLDLVVDPRFEGPDIAQALIRHILLDLHRRRLSTTSFCPSVAAFVSARPEFATLVRLHHHHAQRRVTPLFDRGTGSRLTET